MPGAVIWLHGLGDRGEGGWSGAFDQVLQDRPGTIFEFPTAPEAVVSHNGRRTTAWFDITEMPVTCSEPEAPNGIQESVAQVHAMIDSLLKKGVKAKYIILGGFSQGGAMSLLAGLTYPEKLGGIVSISGWCVKRKDVSSWISNQTTPVLMCFGDGDPIIDISVTSKSSEILQAVLGDTIEIVSSARESHMPALDGPEMTRAFRFITRHLPKKQQKKTNENEIPVNVVPDPKSPGMHAALIFLHGSGDSGAGVCEWLNHASDSTFEKALWAAGIRTIYPSAPAQPYSLHGGNRLTVWFDREKLGYDVPEDADGVTRSVAQIDSVIDKLLTDGISLNRIVVAGMSMGGCLALHVGFGSGRHACQLGAVACLSSFLQKDSMFDSAVTAHVSRLSKDGNDGSPVGPPLFMAHGTADPMILPSWAQATRDRLEALGLKVPADIQLYDGLEHSMCQSELSALAEFIIKYVGCPP